MVRQARAAVHLPRASGKYSKDWRALLRQIRADGWTWEQRGDSTHYRLTRGSQTLSFTINAGDYRAIKNMRARLRRADKERLKEEQ
jgi:hypothetical protein